TPPTKQSKLTTGIHRNLNYNHRKATSNNCIGESINRLESRSHPNSDQNPSKTFTPDGSTKESANHQNPQPATQHQGDHRIPESKPTCQETTPSESSHRQGNTAAHSLSQGFKREKRESLPFPYQ
ncbi:hypothetical protein HID58_072217, partial [Brassica napus]